MTVSMRESSFRDDRLFDEQSLGSMQTSDEWASAYDTQIDDVPDDERSIDQSNHMNATTVDSESPNSSKTFNTLQRDDHLHLLVLMLPANFIIHMGHGCVVSSPVGYNSRETLTSFTPTSDPSSSNWGWSHWPPQGGGLPGNLLCSLRMPAAQPSYSRPQKACFRARRGCWGTDYMCIIWPPPC